MNCICLITYSVHFQIQESADQPEEHRNDNLPFCLPVNRTNIHHQPFEALPPVKSYLFLFASITQFFHLAFHTTKNSRNKLNIKFIISWHLNSFS